MSSSTKFSLYKYSDDIIMEQNDIDFESLKGNSLDYLKKSIDIALNELKKRLNYKQADYSTFSSDNEKIRGLYFYTSNPLEWEPMIKELFLKDKSYTAENNGLYVEKNISSSYIVFMIYNHTIYIITGGYGSKYISNYIDGYFGIDVLPGITTETASNVKAMQNSNFFGTRLSESFINKEYTRLIDEKDMRSIYKNLDVEVKLSELEARLGIKLNEDETKEKNIKVTSKDSLVINRKITFQELMGVIKNIDSIYYTENKAFVLNYFIPASKIKLKKGYIEDQLSIYLSENKNNDFVIIGEDYYDYYANSDVYQLKDDKGNIQIEKKNNEINLGDCYDFFEKEEIKLTKTFIKNFLKKWTISTKKENEEEVLQDVSIIKLLQGHFSLQEQGVTVYLMNGDWVVINPKYLDSLNKEYENFYDENIDKTTNLFFIDKLQNHVVAKEDLVNEDSYNKSFGNRYRENVIVGHKCLFQNVEYADLLIWDSEKLYVVCNKAEFSGAGARDLSNQVMVASEVFTNMVNSSNRDKDLRKYYNSIKSKYYSGIDDFLSEDEFKKLFNKQPVYVAGYLQKFKRNSRSTYAKYLSVAMKKHFKRSLGAEFLMIGDLTTVEELEQV